QSPPTVPLPFFALNSRSSRFLKTSYATEERSAGGVLSHKFFDFLEGGVYGKFSNTGAFKGEDDDLPPINNFFTGNRAAAVNNPTAFLPGFNQNVELVTYGGYGELDKRNNDDGLTKGFYFYGRFGSIEGLDNDQTATSINSSDFGWIEGELDGRVYIP